MAGKPKEAAVTKPDDKWSGGSSSISTAIVMLLLTVLAGSVGFLGGQQIKRGMILPNARAPMALTEVKIERTPALQVLPLPAIVTNLAGASGWVRLEVSVLLGDDQPVAPALVGQLAEDLTVLLRTLTLSQIAGASGFHHLREDIGDRLRTRTKNRVRDITIQSMVIE